MVVESAAERISKLVAADKADDVEALKALLDGVDTFELEVRNIDGYTALISAALNNRVDAIKLLLDRGAQLEAKDNSGLTALGLAAIKNHVDAIELLLDRGAELEAKGDNGATALGLAAYNNHLFAIKVLLDRGAQLEAKDKKGFTALGLAASNNHVFAIKLLLDKGAQLEAKNNSGVTALGRAASNNHVDAIELLLDRGADLEAKENGGATVLCLAALYNMVDAIKVLLDRGAQLEVNDKFGTTALGMAAFSGSVDAVKLLLDRGASYVALNDGRTPYDLACTGKQAKLDHKAPTQELLRPLHEEYLGTKDAKKAAKGSPVSLAIAAKALEADPKTWGAVPSASAPFQRPSAWSVAWPLVELLKSVQADGASLTNIWTKALPLAQQMFAMVVPLIAASDEAQRALLGCFEERKRGSLTQYTAILTRTRRDPTFPEFTSASKRLQQKLAARRGECVQQRPSGALDFAELRSQAGKVKPRFDAFLAALATKCGAERTAAPLKGAWRAIEKMALRVGSAGEKCGALKDGPLDATPLCDVLRGSLRCKDFTMLLTAFELLEALDNEFGDVSQARGLTQRIRLLRIKDRFTAPTSGGWADVLVNFVFVDDESTHVVELQLQHESMLLVRKEGGGHEDYNEFRSAYELLEAVGKEPKDMFEDAEQNAAAEPTQARSEEVAALRDLVQQQGKRIDEQTNRIDQQEKQMMELKEVQAKQLVAIERRLAKQSSSCFGCFRGGQTVPDRTDGVRV